MNKNKLILSLAFIPLMFSSGMATVGLNATNEITDISTSPVEKDLAAWGKSTDLNKLVPTDEDINQELKILTAYPYGSDLYLYFFYAHTDPKPINGFGADISFDYPDDNYTTNFYSGGIVDTYDYGSYDFIKAKISNIYTSSKLNYYYFSKVYLRLAGDLKAFAASSYFNFKGSGEDLLYSNSDDKYCYINDAKVVLNATKNSVYWMDETAYSSSTYYEDFYYFFNIDEVLFDTIQSAYFSYNFFDLKYWKSTNVGVGSYLAEIPEEDIYSVGDKILMESCTNTGTVKRTVKGNALFPLFATTVDLDYINIVDFNNIPPDCNEYFKEFLDTVNKDKYRFAIHVDPYNGNPLYRHESSYTYGGGRSGYTVTGHEISNVTPIKFVVTKDNKTFDLNVFAQPVDTTEGYVTVVKFPSFFDMYVNALKDIWKTFLNVLKIVGISAVGLLVIFVAFKLVNFANTVSTNRQLKKLNKKQKK